MGWGQMEMGVVIKKKNRRDPCVDGNILCLDYINDKIRVATFNCSFARYCHWGEMEIAN